MRSPVRDPHQGTLPAVLFVRMQAEGLPSASA
nr:MAG TPA: hypothetical protein [Caudoviricetes sp.]